MDSSRVLVTRTSDNDERVVGVNLDPAEVRDWILKDALSTDALGGLAEEDREAALDVAIVLTGISDAPFPREGPIANQTYTVEEIPDDPDSSAEFLRDRLRNPDLLYLACSLPGPLRYEIWPNERTHRGRPHCRVSYADRSAPFSIPEGEKLDGTLRPKEALARRTIRANGSVLLNVWNATRPDDQRTPPRQ